MSETMNDVCEFIVDTKHKTPKFTEHGYPCIRTPNIGRGYFILNNAKYVSEESYTEWTERAVPSEGDLIFAREAPVGNVAIIPKGLKVCHGQRTVLIRPDIDKVDSHYLMYLMLGDELQNRMLSMASGATVAHLNMSDIRSLVLPELPSIEEQKEIAQVLTMYDSLIENNNRRIAILEEMAQSLYREWFVKFRYPGHENSKFIDSPLGKIPEGWEVVQIKDIGEVITGKTPSKKKPEYYSSCDVPFLKTPDMHGSIFVTVIADWLSEVGADSQKNKYIPAGSVSVACIGAKAGVVALIPTTVQTNQQINSVVFYDKRMREYFYLFSSGLTELIRAIGSSGATMINVSKGKFESIEFMKPAKVILEDFHNIISPCLDLILNLQKNNDSLKNARDLLLPKLISGSVQIK